MSKKPNLNARAGRIIFALLFAAAAGCASKKFVRLGSVSPPVPSIQIESLGEVPGSNAKAVPLSSVPALFYPLELLRAGLAGYVDVRVTIGKDGLVKETAVIKSSLKEFEVPAIRALQHQRFVEIKFPGAPESSGTAIDCRVTFTLNDD